MANNIFQTVRWLFGSTGPQISSSCGAFSRTANTFADITNLSITITTKGRPVFIGLIHDGSVNAGYLGLLGATSGTAAFSCFQILRDSTVISLNTLASGTNTGTTPMCRVPVSTVFIIDSVAAGTYTYKVQCKSDVLNDNTYCDYAKLIAFEL